MKLTDDELIEFKSEANELLDEAEYELLAIRPDVDTKAKYRSIFRVFHSLKGGAGMLGLVTVQNHMHVVENLLTKFKDADFIEPEAVNFFLSAVDATRRMLDGEEVEFVYEINSITVSSVQRPKAPSSPLSKSEALSGQTRPVASGDPINITHVRPEDASPLIFAVDDEPDILDVLSRRLKASGFKCETFTEPEPMFARIKSSAPDAVITDMTMPKMSGLQVLQKCRDLDPDIPVVFLSGYLSKEVLLNAIASGVHSALEKPFDAKLLLKTVAAAVHQRQLNKLLNSSINLLLYQFHDLDEILKERGKDDVRQTIRDELNRLLSARKALKKSRKDLA